MEKEKLYEGVPLYGMVYGKLFALTNLIQTLGDEFFQEITIKQHFILIAVQLFKEKPPTLKEVAEVAGCSYQNIKKIAILLEKKGYLIIQHDTSDKRKCRLILTGKIHKISAKLDVGITDFFDTLFKNLSERQIKNILAGLLQMERNIEAFKEEKNEKN